MLRVLHVQGAPFRQAFSSIWLDGTVAGAATPPRSGKRYRTHQIRRIRNMLQVLLEPSFRTGPGNVHEPAERFFSWWHLGCILPTAICSCSCRCVFCHRLRKVPRIQAIRTLTDHTCIKSQITARFRRQGSRPFSVLFTAVKLWELDRASDRGRPLETVTCKPKPKTVQPATLLFAVVGQDPRAVSGLMCRV